MIELVEKFDFVKEILPQVFEFTKADFESYEPSESQFQIDCSMLQPRIVGQEKSGFVLLSWVYARNQKSGFTTFVASFDPVNRKTKVIFKHPKNIEIVTASVNNDATLLAFSSVDRQQNAGHVSPAEQGDIYKSYVAEIKPHHRIFSLNIEWRTFQRVQFLDSPESHKISHMLFFHHKESIMMYHIPMAKVDDSGYMMSMLPTTQQIVREFVWCQFDQLTQRLYYLVLAPQDEEGVDAMPLFTVVQFRGNGEAHYHLSFPLPFRMGMDLYRQQALYFTEYVCSRVSANSMNMEVVTSSRGSFYVCFQDPVNRPFYPDETSSTQSHASSPEVVGMEGSLTYSVCCLHNGYVAHCSTMVFSLLDAKQDMPRVSFFPFNDYLIAYLPGEFLHVLDISSEHEPVHNILIKAPSQVPAIPSWDEHALGRPLFSHSMRDSSLHGPSLLFENKTQKAYKVETSIKSLFNLFVSSSASTRLAILHAAIIHLKDSKISRKIIDRVCQDPANSETEDLLKEYLLASPYYHLKKSVSSLLDLKAFPFTLQEAFRGQVERDEGGNRILYLHYKRIREDTCLLVTKALNRCTDDFWSYLRLNLLLETDKSFFRFPVQTLASVALEMDANLGQGFFARFSQRLLGSSQPEHGEASRRRSTSSLPSLFESDQKASLEREKQEEACRAYATMDRLVKHVTKVQGSEAKLKATNMSREYTEVRAKIVRSLWKYILKALKFTTDSDILRTSLQQPTSRHEAALFQVIERLKVATDQLCYPVMPNMNLLFCSLGFRYLSRYQFLEYVDACVFNVTSEFVERVIQEIADSEEDVQLKFQLVSRLAKEDALAALRLWNHPRGNRHLAQHMVAKLTFDRVASPSSGAVLENTEQFVPLHTLLEAISLSGKHLQRSWRKSTGDGSRDELKFLSATALANTDALRNGQL